MVKEQEYHSVNKLSAKRRMFVEEYIKDMNATRAAIACGYSPRSARQIASRLLTIANIQAAISERVAEIAMTSDEVLTRLSDIARADMGDFLDIESMSFMVNLNKAKELGLTKLIKKVREKTVMTSSKDGEETETHTMELELYDAQAALVTLGRYHKMFTDNLDLTSGGEALVIHVVYDEEKE
jgi:phage terminase small subunit